jgi:tetratricopeptide (TPR) repeat protein
LPFLLDAQESAASLRAADASGYLNAARAAYAAGDSARSLALLRRLRGDYPDSPLVTESLSLSIEIALASGDEYLARYFHEKLSASAPFSAGLFRASFLLAEYSYRSREYSPALKYFASAVASVRENSGVPYGDFQKALLRCAELSLYNEKDIDAARGFFRRIDRGSVSKEDAPLYGTLRKRLVWQLLPMETLGISDVNVSCLRVDEDDLWVGTWNGGVARYSITAARSDPFPAPSFSRSIEIADRRVWVGTADGLSWYGKSTGRWGTVERFTEAVARKVQAVKQAEGELYAGTLGDGLLRLGAEGWEGVSDGDLPGRFVNCIAWDGRRSVLLIGTMNMGLVIFDVGTGEMRTLSAIMPEFAPDNVTAVLADGAGRVWVGTYGSLRRFVKASGEIGDDWILAICETDRAVYFGSFGGGVSACRKGNGAWTRYGIAEGLPSLDITAIAWREPYVFFGTLGAGVCMYNESADGAQL